MLLMMGGCGLMRPCRVLGSICVGVLRPTNINALSSHQRLISGAAMIVPGVNANVHRPNGTVVMQMGGGIHTKNSTLKVSCRFFSDNTPKKNPVIFDRGENENEKTSNGKKIAEKLISELKVPPKKDLMNSDRGENENEKNNNSKEIEKEKLSNGQKIEEKLKSELSELSSENEESDSKIDEHDSLIEIEIELARQRGLMVPSKFTPSQWQELRALISRNQRQRYFTFLFKKEQRKINDKAKREERKAVNAKLREEQHETEHKHITYAVFHNSMFLRFPKGQMMRMLLSRLIPSIQYEMPLVFDMSYDQYMQRSEQKNLASQLSVCIGHNASHEQPFHLQICNASEEQNSMKHLHKFFPDLYHPAYMGMHVNEGSYLDIYPKHKLIYLSPHAIDVMEEFDHDAVYIIGGFVDKSYAKPVSLMKAKKEGIRMMKFPLDRYLDWKQSSKNLALNQVVSILLDVRRTGDWKYALRHVPQRKVFGEKTLKKHEQKLKKVLGNNR